MDENVSRAGVAQTFSPLSASPDSNGSFAKTSEDSSLTRIAASLPCVKAFFEQINTCAWDYDHVTHCFSILNVGGPGGSLARQARFPHSPYEGFLAGGIIHPQSVPTYRMFVRRILGGERSGGAVMRIRMSKKSGYSWYYVSFRTLFSTDGQALRTVGALKRTNLDDNLPRLAEYGKSHEDLLPSLCAYACVNLTENRVDALWLAEKSAAGSVGVRSYDLIYRLGLKRLVSAASRKRCAEMLNREALLAAAKEKSPCWIVESHRFVEDSSHIRPVVLHVLLDQDELSGHHYAFFYIQFVDHLCAQAGEYFLRAKRLKESGIFCADDADSVLKRFYEDDSRRRAYAVVRVCSKNGQLGRNQYDFIAGVFGLFYGATSLVSRQSDGLLGIFLPNCESVIQVRKTLESSFVFVRKFLCDSPMSGVYFTAVCTQGKLRQRFQNEFIRNASLICERMQARQTCDAIETISSLTEIREFRNRSCLFSARSLNTSSEVGESALNSVETKMLIECLNVIIATPNAGDCLRQLLDILGCYYGADRVYTVRLIKDGQTLEQMSEWGKNPRKLLKGVISGSSLSKFPLFERVFFTGQPVIVNRLKRAESVASGLDSARKTWSCILLPLFSSGSDFKGVLCLDNPTANVDRLGLVQALLAHLVEIHSRILKERYDFVSYASASAAIYRGFAAFQDKIEGFSSESCASLGVFIAAIPGVLTLANKFGMSHSMAILHFLNEFLPTQCANALIFNTHEHEFVVLMPNTTKEFFFERVARVRRKCEEQFPEQIALGATWSKGLFFGSALVREARSIMLSQKRSLVAAVQESAAAHPMPDFSEVPGRFTVLYQPKVDMLTRTVIGAEALARGIDESGAIVSPRRFIADLEKNGELRTLDLFVLSRVLWQLTNWKRNGFKLLPVSVNFSRDTFAADSTLGAVLALLNNYDEVDPSLVEIEITETGYEIGASTLDRMMKPYRNQGLHFALDDFGSGYANLSIFSEVHFQTIKLDRSLIRNLNNNPISQSLVESIVKISHDTGMTVIAEGVEDEQQAQILLQRECRMAQGYLYGRPMDANSFATMHLDPHHVRV